MKKGKVEAKDELYLTLLGLIEKERREITEELEEKKEKKLQKKVF